MIRRPPRSTPLYSSAASDVYKRQGLGATPIINHPEVSILGIHKAREMPVVLNGQILVRRIMNLSSAFDHRVVDGADGASLIQHLKRMLENPALIFM